MSEIVNTIKTDRGVEVYEHGIYEYLDQYRAERGIEDMTKESQNRWNAALLYIKKHVFINQIDLMSTVNQSMYDEYKINQICDMYINLCYEYDKEVSINGFCFLTGIHKDTVYSWGREEYRGYIYYDKDSVRIGNISTWKINHPGEEYRQELGSSCSDVYKKLVDNNEESLSGMLISGGRNPMKILPALNRRHNWNMGQPRGLDGAKQERTPDQIAADYPMQIGQKGDVDVDF